MVPHPGECLMGAQDGNNPLFYDYYDTYVSSKHP